MNFKKVNLFLFGLPKTLRFNFHYFPFKTAIKLPVLVTHKVYFKKLKGKIKLDGKIKTGMVKIGSSDVTILNPKEKVVLFILGSITFNSGTNIGTGTKIAVGPNAMFYCGKNFDINARTEIVCSNIISFGDDCLLSWDILIMDSDFHPIYDKNDSKINEDRPIKIGNKVWIGCRSLILKGAEIPDNCVIGAGSFVNKKF